MTNPPAAQDRSHYNNFDAIRIAAAFAVLYSHHFALTGRPEPSFFGLHSWGGLAAIVFFVMSGFLVTRRAVLAGRVALQRHARLPAFVHPVRRHALHIHRAAIRPPGRSIVWRVLAGISNPTDRHPLPFIRAASRTKCNTN
jgi:hypothetical protein